jgi:hypothetical protein
MKISPNMECLDEIWEKYRDDYAGKLITSAWKLYGEKKYQKASHDFEKARDGFGKKSIEWQCLESWRAHTKSKLSK